MYAKIREQSTPSGGKRSGVETLRCEEGLKKEAAFPQEERRSDSRRSFPNIDLVKMEVHLFPRPASLRRHLLPERVHLSRWQINKWSKARIYVCSTTGRHAIGNININSNSKNVSTPGQQEYSYIALRWQWQCQERLHPKHFL